MRELFSNRRDMMLAGCALGIILAVAGFYVWGTGALIKYFDVSFSAPPPGTVDAGIDVSGIEALLKS